jgi:hypothetical protein
MLGRLALVLALTGAALSASSAEAASRGYLVTPAELVALGEQARAGVEPHASHMGAVLSAAGAPWDYALRRHETCESADDPAWIDNGGGTKTLVAKAFAFHLTGDVAYARQVKGILERIMSEVETISLDQQQCRLNFAWGTPELVIAADLIEDYWRDATCIGPASTRYGDDPAGSGPCKARFQNWLVKNPYYVVSLSGRRSASNWGAAATNTMAYVADYLMDRPDTRLVHRNPAQEQGGRDAELPPAAAYAAANQLAIDRMNGYRVEYGSMYACGLFSEDSQDPRFPPVKSQITATGIIPEDARREQSCNILLYDGSYQNHPQLHIGHNVQQCELMRRRGDVSCFDNVDRSDVPDYAFVDPRGESRSTHLQAGRGSLERAIHAVIVDSDTEWRHTSALVVAYRYYRENRQLPGIERWIEHLDRRAGDCAQDICFGTLTHGLTAAEIPPPPGSAPPAGPGVPGRPFIVAP